MTKPKKILIAVVIVVLIILIISTTIYLRYKKEYISFDVSFLKVAIVEGGTAVSNINIDNKGNKKVDFSVNVDGMEELKNFVSIEENNFELEPGKEKDMKFFFNAEGKSPGVYIGSLEFSYNKKIKQIPVVLEILSKEVLFDSNINLFPKDGFVPGGKLTAEIKIFDLVNLGRTNVNLTYFIKDFKGRTIVSESGNLVIDGKFDYFKSINLPDDINLGSYILAVIIEYDNSIGTSSSFFEISKKNLIKFDNTILLIILLFILFFTLFLGLFIYFLFYRDKLLKELYGQYKKELKREKEYIRLREARDYRILKSPLEKKIYKKQIRKVQKERIRAIKEIYKKRLKKFKEIKKKGDKAILMKHLKQWKARGYDTRILENKFKIPNVNEIRKKIKQWKARGYDTRILEKKL